MQGYNFTERVRKCLAFAREEAQRLRHDYVGTEHILLGILREGEGVATAVLLNLGVEPEGIVRMLAEIVQPGKPSAAVGPDLPYTSRAKRVLELAMRGARELDHSYVGTEHLLIGLIDEEKGIAAQVLREQGATAQNVRAETLRLLGHERPAERAERDAPQVASSHPPPGHRETLEFLRTTAEVPFDRAQTIIAQLRLLNARADLAEERRKWLRVNGVLDLCARLGLEPRLAGEQGGMVRIELGTGMSVVVELPGLADRAAPGSGGAGE